MAFVRGKVGGHLENIVIFSGTIGMLGGEFLFGGGFSAELVDGHLDRHLHINYKVMPLDYLSVD
jgi:hypothetical protein